MMKYKMGVFEYPSSSSEPQGTNGDTSESSDWATVVPNQPKLLVQYLGASVPGDLTWSTTSDQWTSASTTLVVNPVSFAVELNVGGKYIFDASKRGWTPANDRLYRVTFCTPDGSQVDMRGAYTGDAATEYLPSAGGAAPGYVDPVNNLAYIDLECGGENDPGGGDE